MTFGICWIEDQPSDPERAAVEAAVRASGFEPDIFTIDSEDEINAFAKQQDHFQEFDLILLDMRLSPTLQGDELAPYIRESFRSTPILFYSAAPEPQLRMQMAEKNVDGVYCASRDDFPTRVGELVEGLAPALNRLSGMRGLAARVVAECDQELRGILLHLGTGELPEADIVQSLKKQFCDLKQRQKQNVGSHNSLPGLLDEPSISSGLLFQEVRNRVDADPTSSQEIRALSYELRQYTQLVLARRNILAHALEEKTDEGWRISRRGPDPHLTSQDFAEFRADFLSHLKNFRKLRELVVSKKPG